MLGVSRILVVIGAVLLGLGGLFAIASGEFRGVVAGVALLLSAVVMILAIQYERTRYRSDAATPAGTPSGPGGEAPGELLDPRFQTTDEVFVDPSSGQRMRVFLDPRTGERRYSPEA